MVQSTNPQKHSKNQKQRRNRECQRLEPDRETAEARLDTVGLTAIRSKELDSTLADNRLGVVIHSPHQPWHRLLKLKPEDAARTTPKNERANLDRRRNTTKTNALPRSVRSDDTTIVVQLKLSQRTGCNVWWKKASKQASKQANKQTNKSETNQTDKPTNRQTDRPTDRQSGVLVVVGGVVRSERMNERTNKQTNKRTKEGTNEGRNETNEVSDSE